MLLKIADHIARTSSWTGEKKKRNLFRFCVRLEYNGVSLVTSVTTTAKGMPLLHTSRLTFPDFNNHSFPISLINPRVAVSQSSCTKHWSLPDLLLVGASQQCAWQGVG